MDLFDILMAKKLSGSGDVSVDSLSVTENGTYTAEEGHAYSPVEVNVSGGGGGDHDVEDGIITRTISGAYTNSRVTEIGLSAFAGCVSLTAINFPKVTSIGGSAFQSCPGITEGYFPKVTSIASYAFRSCYNLMSLYVLASSVATLGGNALTATPFNNSTYTGSFGSIYVPASLVDSYKSANNWSVFSARITSYVE